MDVDPGSTTDEVGRDSNARTVPGDTALSSLVLAEGETPVPLAKPGETYVSPQAGLRQQVPVIRDLCLRLRPHDLRSNNEYTADKGVVHKNGMRSVHERIAKYLHDYGRPCRTGGGTAGKSDPSVATVQASQPQLQTSWSSGCTNQIEKGRSIVKVFKNQTGMRRLINL